MAEGVKVYRRRWFNAEMLFEVALAQQNLPDKRFTAGHIAVGLQIPAAHDVPFVGLDQFLNPLEQCWVVLLDPLVENDFIMIENKCGIVFAKFSRRSKC
ncbi:hypothetical protein ES703_89643 [subsurface metagenome]